MNIQDWFNKNKDEVEKAGMTLIRNAIKLGSHELHQSHIGVKDSLGRRVGDFEIVVSKLDVKPLHHDAPIVIDRPDASKQEGAVPSTEYYVLLIDKDRDTMLNIMLQAFSHIQAVGLPGANPTQIVEMNESIKSLSKEIAKKHHEKGWCTDPNCSYKTKHQ